MRGDARRLTPLKALELLRRLERNRAAVPAWLLDELASALADHVRAELSKKRRRRRG